MNDTDQEQRNSQEFKRRLGEAFQSMPNEYQGAFILGKFFILGGSEDPSRALAQRMSELIDEHSEEEIIRAIAFLDSTTSMLHLLKRAMMLRLAEKKKMDTRRN